MVVGVADGVKVGVKDGVGVIDGVSGMVDVGGSTVCELAGVIWAALIKAMGWFTTKFNPTISKIRAIPSIARLVNRLDIMVSAP